MLLRSSIRPLARQFTASISQSKAAISTTPKKAALYDGPGHATAQQLILGVDESTSTKSSSSAPSPSASSKYAAARGLRPATKGGGGADLGQQMERSGAYSFLGLTKASNDETLKLLQEREELQRQAPRPWQIGDVYAPHDLSAAEMRKWSKLKSSNRDEFDLVGINPLDHYKNFSMISEYMTDQGRIKHSRLTGLRPVNQRKIAKAIRRAIGMGIHPSTHKHPDILFPNAFSGPRYQTQAPAQEAAKKPAVKPE